MFEVDDKLPSGNGDLGPLLRRSGENVKLEAVEESLLKKNLTAELVILYGKHGRHHRVERWTDSDKFVPNLKIFNFSIFWKNHEKWMSTKLHIIEKVR